MLNKYGKNANLE